MKTRIRISALLLLFACPARAAYDPSAGSGSATWTRTARTSADGNYTILAADQVMALTACTGTAIWTLPTAVGIAGKWYRFVDESSQVVAANSSTECLVSVAPQAAEAIAGWPVGARMRLWKNRQTFTLLSDGAGWQVVAGAEDAVVDPRSIATLWAWFTAAHGLTVAATTGLVTVWNDLSDNGFDVTAGASPVYRTSISPHKRPGLEFTSDYLTRANVLHDGGGTTAFAVVSRVWTTGTYRAIWSHAFPGSGTEGQGMWQSGATIGDYVNGDVNVIGDDDVAGVSVPWACGPPSVFTSGGAVPYTHLVYVRLGAAGTELRVDGTVTSRTIRNGAIPAATGTLVIGGIVTPGDYIDGLIHELIVYETALTDAQAAAIEVSLMRAYRIR